MRSLAQRINVSRVGFMVRDRQKRMAQTLGCLVASMTACAVLLHWGQPGPERAVAAPGFELAANTVKQAWQGVRIDAGRLDGQLDAASTHFFVDREGRGTMTDAWKSQGQLRQKGIVHITLQPSAKTKQITPAQWDTTSKLLSELFREWGIPNDGKHVVLSDALAVPARSGSQAESRSKARPVSAAGAR